MPEPIEESYFKWLCAKVLDVNIQIYWDLMLILHRTEFVWIVDKDRNRAADGCELRDDFLREAFIRDNREWHNAPCSVLEMLIAFSKRVSFQTGQPARDWFWIFMTNLQLDEYRQVSQSDVPVIEDILYDFVWRQYDSNGYGGLFPMRWPKHDQREVEIWYQFSEYLDDQGLL